MTDVEAHGARRQTERTGSSRPDANHPLPLRPLARNHPEPAEVPASEATVAAAAVGAELDDAVMQLAGALRTAERAHREYLAELCLDDVKPAEDWSTWYAEYLVGLR